MLAGASIIGEASLGTPREPRAGEATGRRRGNNGEAHWQWPVEVTSRSGTLLPALLLDESCSAWLKGLASSKWADRLNIQSGVMAGAGQAWYEGASHGAASEPEES